jgi:hypothetical protein
MFVNKHFQTLNCKKKGQKYLTFFKLKLTGLFSLSITELVDISLPSKRKHSGIFHATLRLFTMLDNFDCENSQQVGI